MIYKAVCLKQGDFSDETMSGIARAMEGKPALMNYDQQHPVGFVYEAAFIDGGIVVKFESEASLAGMFAGPGYRLAGKPEAYCLGIFASHTDSVSPIETQQ
jgi:hypothetical protein